MAYFRLNQILREDDDQSIVCRTRLRDRLIAGMFFVFMSCFWLFFALFTLSARLPFLPAHYSVNSWPLFLAITCLCVPLLWCVFIKPHALRLNLTRRTYRMVRGFFPLVLVNSGPLEDVHHLSVLRVYQTGNLIIGGRVCTYMIQLDWKKMQWLHQSKIARWVGWDQESAVTLGTSESLEEAEAKAKELAAKIGVPYAGMHDPQWMPKGNRPA